MIVDRRAKYQWGRSGKERERFCQSVGVGQRSVSDPYRSSGEAPTVLCQTPRRGRELRSCLVSEVVLIR